MTFRFVQLVGRYRLVVTSELLLFIERTFIEPLPVAEREAARSEAIAEANAAELELTAEGVFISRSGGQEFFRVNLGLDLADHEQLDFEKAPGQRVTLRPLNQDTLLATQPGRPATEFRRVQSHGLGACPSRPTRRAG